MSHLNIDGAHCTSLTGKTLLLSGDGLCWQHCVMLLSIGSHDVLTMPSHERPLLGVILTVC